MKRTYCDACHSEIVNDRIYAFEPLLHICEIGEGRHAAYVDRDFNATSGRTAHFDLCLPCYNDVFSKAYKTMKNLKK